jgi:hypothetical protein
MEPLRLDPADPLASVLRWLAALARALGVDPARVGLRVELSHAGAAWVRSRLSVWSRQLRALIRAEAVRLARTLQLRPRAVAARGAQCGAASAPGADGTAARRGRFTTIVGPRRVPLGGSGPAFIPASARRSDPLSLFRAEADAALRRRQRALFAALRDRAAAARRLALRLARHLARTRDARFTLDPRRRFPLPPRALSTAPRGVAPAPEPRPPDRPATVRPEARPASLAAATVALARISPLPCGRQVSRISESRKLTSSRPERRQPRRAGTRKTRRTKRSINRGASSAMSCRSRIAPAARPG